MSYELSPTQYGAQLRANLEQTYNSGPTIAAGDLYRCPVDASFDAYKRTWIDRITQAPKISGVRASAGQGMGEYSIEVVLDHKTIPTTPDTTTESGMSGVPQADLFLRAGGWQVSSANTNYTGIAPDSVTLGAGADNQLTYVYDPRSTGVNFTSARVQYLEIAENLSEGYLHDLKGARHGWTLRMPGGDHWVLACDGKSLATKPAKQTGLTLGSSFVDNTAIVGLGANYSVTQISGPATFGKSAEDGTAASLTAFCYNMELESNLEIAEVVAPNGNLGVAQVRYNAGRPRLTMTLDQVTWSDDWDLYTFADANNAIRVSHACPVPGASATDFVLFQFTGQIVEIERAEQNGYKTTNVTLDYLYPDAAADGGGLVPADSCVFKYITIV